MRRMRAVIMTLVMVVVVVVMVVVMVVTSGHRALRASVVVEALLTVGLVVIWLRLTILVL